MNQSHARHHLHHKFKDLNVGCKFQIVNSIMGAAMSTSMILIKIVPDPFGKNAMRGTELFKVRDETPVELIQ